jgi:hypothetical protein
MKNPSPGTAGEGRVRATHRGYNNHIRAQLCCQVNSDAISCRQEKILQIEPRISCRQEFHFWNRRSGATQALLPVLLAPKPFPSPAPDARVGRQLDRAIRRGKEGPPRAAAERAQLCDSRSHCSPQNPRSLYRRRFEPGRNRKADLALRQPAHECQSIPQLLNRGTESHRRRTQETWGTQRPRAISRREVHAAHRHEFCFLGRVYDFWCRKIYLGRFMRRTKS